MKPAEIIHKPKIVVPAALIVAAIIGVFAYGKIGRAPNVSIPSYADSASASTSETTSGSVNLSFPKGGRIAAVNVNIGDRVKKGQVLASLEAGDALGAVNQAKGALELAKAQYASLDVQYANAKKQQDVLVDNARRTLLSTGLAAIATRRDYDKGTTPVDSDQTPTVSGTYTCDKEGSYTISPYASGVPSGYSFTIKGLEEGLGNVAIHTPQPLGTCGLFIQFPEGYSATNVDWLVEIPNTRSANYVANKNAYDLALATRDQILKQYEANLGQNGSSAAATAKASIDSAQGAYETALGAYKNTLIIAPLDGVVTFIDSHLRAGESVGANKTVINVSQK